MEVAMMPRQRDIALARANKIRLARAEIRGRLAKGESPIPYLMRPPEELKTMRLFELLRSCRRCGTAKAREIILRAQQGEGLTVVGRIGEGRLVGDLSERQKALVIQAARATTFGREW